MHLVLISDVCRIETVSIRQFVNWLDSARPKDFAWFPFSSIVLEKEMQNGDVQDRDWLSWSPSLFSYFCFFCCLFCSLNDTISSNLVREEDGRALAA